jgi:hypothetical protein
MDSSETEAVLDRIIAFLDGVGVPVGRGEVAETSFLPGVRVQAGGLVVDPARLICPGDLLREAGHIAVTPADRRAGTDEALEFDPGLETLLRGPMAALVRHDRRSGLGDGIRNGAPGRAGVAAGLTHPAPGPRCVVQPRTGVPRMRQENWQSCAR